MSRLEIASPKRAKIVMEGLYKDLERRIESSPSGTLSGGPVAGIFGVMPCADMRQMRAMPNRPGAVESFNQGRS